MRNLVCECFLFLDLICQPAAPSAILTIFQIEGSNQPVTRTTALISLVCALMSLIFGCIYILRFATMRSMKKACRWAEVIIPCSLLLSQPNIDINILDDSNSDQSIKRLRKRRRHQYGGTSGSSSRSPQSSSPGLSSCSSLLSSHSSGPPVHLPLLPPSPRTQLSAHVSLLLSCSHWAWFISFWLS